MNENLNNVDNITMDAEVFSISRVNRLKAMEVNYVFIISTFLQVMMGIGFTIVICLISSLMHIKDENTLYYYFFSPLTEILSLLFPALIYLFVKKVGYKETLRLNKIKLKYIIPLVVIGISVQYVGGFLNYFVTYFLSFLGNVPTSNIPAPNNILQLIYTIFFIAAVPAVCEEILFRGVVMKGYEGLGQGYAVAISALLFGLMHYSITNFVFPIFLGLILGFVVYRTNSIFSAVIIHFVNNAFGAFMLYFWNAGGENVVQPSNLQELLNSSMPAVIGTVIMACFLYYIYKTTGDKAAKVEKAELSVEERTSLKILLHWPLIFTYGFMALVTATTILKIIKGIE